MKINIIISLLITIFFSGCLAVDAVVVPFQITTFALDTTAKVVNIGSKVATTTVNVGSKIINTKQSTIPAPAINVNLD